MPLDAPVEFPALSFHDVDNFHLVLAPEIPAWVTLGDDEWKVLLGILGSPTLGHAVNDYGADAVATLLGRMMSAGFFRSANMSPYRIHLQFHVTNRCNLRCRHCYLDSGVTQMDEMTLDEWRGLLDAAVNVASTRRLFLSISGGEPLLQDFTPDLIAYARRVGISEVAIITNGLLLDSNMVHRLETAGLTNLAISLDGATESVNDRVRGRGVFASVMRALRILQGSTIRVNLNITVMRMNADDLLQHLQEIATKFPNVDISLGQYVVEGRGVAFAREAAMPRPESDTVVRQLARIVSTTRFPLPPARTHSCGYGDTVVVYSNGDLAPCITPQFKRGNVRREGVEAFAKILREAATADVDTLPLCRVCDLRYICGGKCHQGQVARFGRALQNQCSDTYRNNFYRTLTMRVSSGG